MAIAKKICLVGDFSVGKTSLIRRFVDGQFSDEYLSTVGVKLSRKRVTTLATDAQISKEVELLIWDIEGQTQFKAIAPSYLQGAKGAIIVADVKRKETITHVQDHLDLFFKINAKGWVIVALNKIDLLPPDQQADLIARCTFEQQHRQVIATYSTSAKTGEAVQTIFESLATVMLTDP